MSKELNQINGGMSTGRSQVVKGGSFLFLICVFYFLFFIFYFSSAQVNPDAVIQKRAELEAELKELESQIEDYRSSIQEKQKEATTFERDIAILNAKIQKSLLEIKARKLAIEKLTENISERLTAIENLAAKIDAQKMSLAELIRRINELDDTSLIELLLKYDNLSDFFGEFDTYDTLQAAMQDSLQEIRGVKKTTESEKEKLEQQKTEEIELKQIQELEKKRIDQNKSAKNQLLKTTKGEEQKYQKLLSRRQKQAAEIRSQLFLLRGSPAIPFEKALNYGNIVFQKLAVRPAFLLGVIAEESELGANIGSGNWQDDLYNCYKKIGKKEAAEKQKKAFLEITEELGLNPDLMPVSKAPSYGCGGAMGPAQFMPTTWQLYKDSIGQMSGNNPPNPWEPLDAFVAAGLLLKDNGAAAGNYNAEWKAALKYFAGSNWNKPAYRFYGDDVMALAQKYQEQIDILENL